MELPNDVWGCILDYLVMSIEDVLMLQTINKWWHANIRVRGLVNVGKYTEYAADDTAMALIPQLYNIDKMHIVRHNDPIPGSTITLHCSSSISNFSSMTTLRNLSIMCEDISNHLGPPQGLHRLKLNEVEGSSTSLVTTSLTRLDIISSHVRVDPSSLTHLQYLRIENDIVGSLQCLSQLQTLRVPAYKDAIDLTGWPLTRLDIKTTIPDDMLLGLVNLRDLTIYGAWDNGGRAYDQSLVEKLSLTTLRLRDTKYHYSNMLLTALRNLDTKFSHTVTHDGITSLRIAFDDYAPEIPNGIRSLKLQRACDSHFVNDVMSLTSLTYLDVRHSRALFNVDVIDKIRNALPGCTIRY